MGNQAGRRLKQQLSQEKSEKRRKKKMTLKQKKQRHEGEKQGNSPYQIKQQLKARGIYSANSPFSLVETEERKNETNPESKTPKNIQRSRNRVFLTKLFNNGAAVECVNKVKEHRDFYFPAPPKGLENAPCLLMAEMDDHGAWRLSRQFEAKSAPDSQWVRQDLKSMDYRDEQGFITLLSKWQYNAYWKSGTPGELSKTLRPKYTCVENHGRLFDHDFS